MMVNGIDYIIARWHAVCQLCRCAIMPGQKVILLPRAAGARTRTVLRFVDMPEYGMTGRRPAIVEGDVSKPKGRKVQHVDGECGSCYRVRLVYDSTSKYLEQWAFQAEDACKTVVRSIKPKAAQPSAVIVYQGNVPVYSEAINHVIR